MRLRSINLDAGMSAAAVLERLALNGIWLDAAQPAATRRIEAVARRLGVPAASVVARLARDARHYGAAIRRQWGTNVLWYAREIQEVLSGCSSAPAEQSLLDVLSLHEIDSEPPFAEDDGGIPDRNAVVMLRGEPVAVVLRMGSWKMPGGDLALAARSEPTRGDYRSRAPTEMPVEAWPRIDAPDSKEAGQAFDVVVGFAQVTQATVLGQPVRLPFSSERQELTLEIHLITGPEIHAVDGWKRALHVTATDFGKAQVTFRLIGSEPENAERSILTTLEVHYVLDGAVCGTASRPLAIRAAGHGDGPDLRPLGVPWGAATSSTAITLTAEGEAPDLTLEISKPDRNAASGQYVCRLLSPHIVNTASGPFEMNLGQDAKTLAASSVEELRQYARSELLPLSLEGLGRLVADRLPVEFFQALAEVAQKTAPAPPTLLIVSAEPFVPWELAWMDSPLDPKVPNYIGAQALVGRWLRETGPASQDPKVSARPATQPLSAMSVQNMAAMAAWYSVEAGLRRLPKAEAEVDALTAAYPGIRLTATSREMRALLSGTLQGKAGPMAVDVVHFAGHGDFDPSRPDSSTLFLQDGTPLRSNLFRAAKFGGPRQPLLFLNACMLGIGGELLGDMAGFSGNSLRGGFGGVLGALWEVDDQVAHDVAIEFWQRALPHGTEPGEPISAILRDIRSRFRPDDEVPIATYLAYVYYGHPRLTLRRNPSTGAQP